MRPAASIARYPQVPGRCARCNAELLDQRSASVELIAGKQKLTCRDRTACRDRRQMKEEPPG
jgi:DNA-directed RNA polymerase subunit RPC12/RpoP